MFKELIKKQEDEFAELVIADLCQRGLSEMDAIHAKQKYEDFISKVRKESIEIERERIKKIIKDMPDTFPELESDAYDEAYKDAKSYMLNKLK